MKTCTGVLTVILCCFLIYGESLADREVLNRYGESEKFYNYESLYKNEVISFCNAVGVRPVGMKLPKLHVGGAFKAMIVDPVKLDRVCRHKFFYQLGTFVLICNLGDGLFEFHNLNTGELQRVRQDIDLKEAERQLGILPDMPVDHPPWKDGYTFYATVLEPEKLRNFEYSGNRNGDRVKVICVTRLRWKILNLRTDIERDMLYFFGKWVMGWEFPGKSYCSGD